MKIKRLSLSLLLFGGIAITAWAGVANWPTSGWLPLYGQNSLYSDIPNDTGNNGHAYLDFVGDTNYAAAFMLYRSAADSGEAEDQLLFRARLDDKKNKMSGAYQIFFETSYDSSVDWVLQLETSDLDTSGTIEFGSASGTNRSGVAFGAVVWSSTFTPTAGDAKWTGTTTGDGSSFNGDADYFLDIAIPWAVFTNYTGITSTNDPFRLLFTSSQSGGQIDDGDVGNSAAATGVDVVFDDIYADPDPASGPYTQTLSFSNPGNQSITDSVNLSATASSGLPVVFTVASGPGSIASQSNLTFTGSGVVVIVASQPGNSNWLPAPPITNSFTVTGVAATVTLNDLNPTYDGTAQTATATTVPAGLTVDLTYNGSSVAPTNAGSYTVIGTINDAVYQGAATNTFTIAQGAQSLTFPNPGAQLATNSVVLSATSDSGLAVTNFTLISGPGSLSGSTLSFTGAGTVLVSASQSGDANWAAAIPVTNSISVSKAPASINVTGLTPTYDGSAQSVGVTTDPSGQTVDITYNGSSVAPTNAGSYTVIVTVNEPLYQGSVTNTFTIAQADQSITFTNPGPQAQSNTVNLVATSGSGLAVTFSVASGPATLIGSTLTFTDSGTVVINADQAGDLNWNAATQTNVSFSVGKTPATVTLSGLNPTYDGTAQTATATTVPAGLTVDLTYNGSSVAPTNAGSYTVIGTINDAVYQGAATNTFTIAQGAQSLTFPNPGAQLATNSVVLSATSDSGLAVTNFTLISGPGSLSGSTLSFTGAGTVLVSASQSGDANWAAAIPVTNAINISAAAMADVSMQLTGQTNGVIGLPMTFVLTVANSGPSSASNVVVQALLPTNKIFTIVADGGILTNNMVVWPEIAVLTSGTVSNFILTLTTTNTGVYTNTASAGSSTFDPDPTNNDGSTGLSQLAVEIFAADYGLLEGPIVLNPQTGLFEQQVLVTNTTPVAVPAFHILVAGLRSGVTLYNASGTTNGVPYVQVNTALNPGETTDVMLEYYVPDRQSFTNILSVVWTLSEDSTTVPGSGVAVDTALMDMRDPVSPRFLIEFMTVPGAIYTVLYSDDLATWYEAVPPVVAGSSRTQWYDDGPPKTRTHPRDTTNRFYRVIESD